MFVAIIRAITTRLCHLIIALPLSIYESLRRQNVSHIYITCGHSFYVVKKIGSSLFCMGNLCEASVRFSRLAVVVVRNRLAANQQLTTILPQRHHSSQKDVQSD
jgi:hypothetical protein